MTARDKKPNFLHVLPMPKRQYQSISMDFKQLPRDQDDMDNVFLLADRLRKRSFTILCKRSVTAKQIAWTYYDRVWRI